MPAGPCSVNNCFKSGGSKHRFPDPAKNKFLFDQWLTLCGNPRLVMEATPAKVYKGYRVCSLHFMPEDFDSHQKLKKGVLPSVKLPEPLKLLDQHKGTCTEVEANVKIRSVMNPPLTATSIKDTSTSMQAVADTGQSIYVADEPTKEIEVFASTSGIQECSPVLTPGSKTPKRKRSDILSTLNVSSSKQLSPKARVLFSKNQRLRSNFLRARRSQLAFKKKYHAAQRISKTELFDRAVSSMDRIRARFFKSQLENVGKKPKGRRYTLEDKVLGLAFLKQSGSGYKFLSKVFDVPSRKTLTRLLNRIPIQAGLHEQVFSVLAAECKNFKYSLDKHCFLTFDEMSIQPHIHPNLQEGAVRGFEDFGYKQTDQICNHVQVFMLRGIKRKWKQPVFYNFVNGSTKHIDLVAIIKLIIRKCHSIGLNVVSTICDQGASNQAAINYLVRQTQEEYKKAKKDMFEYMFEVDGKKVIPLFDVPHLFKGIRNNLLKYSLTFMEDEKNKTATWSDIYKAYKMDPYLGSLRLMPKLTDAHVNIDKINKMKVSKCTQVLSHSVAAAINVFAFSGMSVETEGEVLKLEPNAADTASLLEFLDQLFDSLNGSAFQGDPGKTLRSAVKQSSGHVSFWTEAITKLKTFKFIRDGKTFIPPSLKNLIQTIKNFKELWIQLKKLGFKYMMPRTFNQDPLENFFGKIRQRGQRNINPTPTDFINYYKGMIVNQLTSPHSVGANCEDDNSEMFFTLQRFVTQGLPEEDGEEEKGILDFGVIPESISGALKPIEASALKYVAGYVMKKLGKLSCNCKELFLVKTEDISKEIEDCKDFLNFKEYKKTKSLKYVNLEFLQKMETSYNIIKYIFNKYIHKRGLVDFTTKVLCERINFTQCFHENVIKKKIFRYFIRVNLFNYCKQVNRILKGLDLRPVPSNAPNIFLGAKKIQINSMKRKKAKQNKNRYIN